MKNTGHCWILQLIAPGMDANWSIGIGRFGDAFRDVGELARGERLVMSSFDERCARGTLEVLLRTSVMELVKGAEFLEQ